MKYEIGARVTMSKKALHRYREVFKDLNMSPEEINTPHYVKDYVGKEYYVVNVGNFNCWLLEYEIRRYTLIDTYREILIALRGGRW